eukprot:TRINITY_DN5386_c0_g1_i2.p1 TRINITY_DN5386_c0_g1~~TRINITY_DN5386_c0_g1_i2.p1  ORF type:complete len:491 (+),score=98.97 TRINITY_DN5386_c0_g1_i2:61-1533(+)
MIFFFFFFQAEDGIRDAQESRGLGDVYKRQVYAQTSLALFVDCSFERNGGASAESGGGLYIAGPSRPVIRRTKFVGNMASHGGAAFVSDRSLVSFEDTVFENNSATSGGAVAVNFFGVSPEFNGCLFQRNKATMEGGGVSMRIGSAADFSNCTWSDNLAASSSGSGEISDQGFGLFGARTEKIRLDSCTILDSVVLEGCESVHMNNSFIRSLGLLGAQISLTLTALTYIQGFYHKPDCSSDLWTSQASQAGPQPFCRDSTDSLVLTHSPNPVVSLLLKNVRPGIGNLTIQSGKLVDSLLVSTTAVSTTLNQFLPLCAELSQGQGIHCAKTYSPWYWLAIVGGPVILVILVIIAVYWYVIFRRDWWVHQEEPEERKAGLEELLLDASTSPDGCYDTNNDGQDGPSFEYFGYGMIDYKRELWLHEVIGSGNYGLVRRATLRRRQYHPARNVAVKELYSHDSSDQLIDEARAMSIPHLSRPVSSSVSQCHVVL